MHESSLLLENGPSSMILGRCVPVRVSVVVPLECRLVLVLEPPVCELVSKEPQGALLTGVHLLGSVC